MQSWHETHSAHQCRQTAHRWNGAICHFTWRKRAGLRSRSTSDKSKCRKAKKQKENTLTKTFSHGFARTCCLALASRWSGGKRTFGFTASCLRSVKQTFSTNTCVPVCPAWSAAISSPGIPNNKIQVHPCQTGQTCTWLWFSTVAMFSWLLQLPLSISWNVLPVLSLPSIVSGQNSPEIKKYLLCTCAQYILQKERSEIDIKRPQTCSASQMLVPPSRWDLRVHQSSSSSWSESMTLRLF